MIFNERAFLIRCLAGIFLIQFATVGYLAYSCQASLGKENETEKVNLICGNASNSFNETGKLALATILALLVPSDREPQKKILPRRPRRKTEEEPSDPFASS
jgi:hypothetical protein